MSMKSKLTIVISVLCLFAGSTLALTPSPKGVELYIIAPLDGAEVSNPVTVRFGLKGMGVAPAGIEKTNTGHHHLLIDVTRLPALDRPLPADANHQHFGAGQTETEIELSPGKHSLQLILGDHNHIPLDPAVISDKINILVK